MRFFRLAGLLLILGLLPHEVLAQQQMRVPFNFRWGESSQRVEQSLVGIKARVVERKVTAGRTALVVEGIPQKQLLRVIFYFKDDAMNEIELHYGDRSWDTPKYEYFFEDVRKNIEGKYGLGRQISRTRSREGDVLQTLIGYHWLQGTMSLRLFLFTANKDDQALRVLSLHYKEF